TMRYAKLLTLTLMVSIICGLAMVWGDPGHVGAHGPLGSIEGSAGAGMLAQAEAGDPTGYILMITLVLTAYGLWHRQRSA
ncbi:MAG: hypothetical protein ACOCXX_04475, partial [Planctomycetota bacterium]